MNVTWNSPGDWVAAGTDDEPYDWTKLCNNKENSSKGDVDVELRRHCAYHDIAVSSDYYEERRR
jgi:hypothetical protein